MAGYTPLPDGVPGSPPDTAFAPPIQAEYAQQRGVWDRLVLGERQVHSERAARAVLLLPASGGATNLPRMPRLP